MPPLPAYSTNWQNRKFRCVGGRIRFLPLRKYAVLCLRLQKKISRVRNRICDDNYNVIKKMILRDIIENTIVKEAIIKEKSKLSLLFLLLL